MKVHFFNKTTCKNPPNSDFLSTSRAFHGAAMTKSEVIKSCQIDNFRASKES